MALIAKIRRPDGTVGVYEDAKHNYVDADHARGHWVDGNFSCDCNRALLLDGVEHPCGSVHGDDNKYALLSLSLDGTVVLPECNDSEGW